jgi:hypothetical protein
LAISNPIVLTFIGTVSFAALCHHRPAWHNDAARGPSTQHCEERSDEAIPIQSCAYKPDRDRNVAALRAMTSQVSACGYD